MRACIHGRQNLCLNLDSMDLWSSWIFSGSLGTLPGHKQPKLCQLPSRSRVVERRSDSSVSSACHNERASTPSQECYGRPCTVIVATLKTRALPAMWHVMPHCSASVERATERMSEYSWHSLPRRSCPSAPVWPRSLKWTCIPQNHGAFPAKDLQRFMLRIRVLHTCNCQSDPGTLVVRMHSDTADAAHGCVRRTWSGVRSGACPAPVQGVAACRRAGAGSRAVSVAHSHYALLRLLLTRCNGSLHVYDHGSSTWPRALPKLTDRGGSAGSQRSASQPACTVYITHLVCLPASG